MEENKFKEKIKEIILDSFKGAILLNLDPSVNFQGVPDLLILYKERWAVLEFKKMKNANYQPNQTYWVHKMDTMSFARFIYPENAEYVLKDLELFFEGLFHEF